MQLIPSRLWLGAILGLAISASSANANLLVNGSFEEPVIASGTFEYIDPAEVPGWEGDSLEIWNHLYETERFAAVDGEQILELNSQDGGDGIYEIYQSFDTVEGEWYQVSLSAQARRTTDEIFWYSVEGNGEEIFSEFVDYHTTAGWMTLFYQFQATSEVSTLYLTSTTDVASNLVKASNLIDDVVVLNMEENNILNVSAPLGAGIGMLLLGFARGRNKNKGVA